MSLDLIPGRTDLGHPPRLYPAGRRCTRKGCSTILSRYNRGPDCRAHTVPKLGTGRDEIRNRPRKLT